MLNKSSRELRILQIVNTLDHDDGGPARNAFELNLALNRLPGIQAALLWINGSSQDSVAKTHSDAGGAMPPVPPRGLKVHGGPFAKLQDLRSALLSSDAVIIHGYFLSWIPPIILLSRWHRRRVFLMPHGALTRYERLRKRSKKAAFHVLAGWWMNKLIAAFVTGSEIERQELIEDKIGNAVHYAGVGSAEPRKQILDLPLSDPVRLLTMSRIAPKKRIDVALRATRMLLDDGVRVTLTVAGSGTELNISQIERYIDELDLTRDVRMSGLVTGAEKEELLSSSDIFLLPSEDENFGIGVAEAAMHGLFVVASTKVAAAEMLSSRSAMKLNSLSPRDFADGIRTVIDNYRSDTRTIVGSEARRQFAWSTVAERWVTIVRQGA
ncbi:glycosyltransferase [Microbacterium testaceum]|uniref:glycosyltransferase n=1 Tax=Microbacterium testaceum TaxID=2033 RepID=UPI001246C234|nr:glycosyltransferase [Microbacterium testaceum]